MMVRFKRLGFLVAFLGLMLPVVAVAQTETIDEVYKKALKEEGVLNCYCSLAQFNAEIIYPLFEKRFPAIKSNISIPPLISSPHGRLRKPAGAGPSRTWLNSAWKISTRFTSRD